MSLEYKSATPFSHNYITFLLVLTEIFLTLSPRSARLSGWAGHVYIETFYAFIFYPLNLANSKRQRRKQQRNRLRLIWSHLATRVCRQYPYLRGLTGVAYPLSMAMREPKGWDRQREADPTLFIYTWQLHIFIHYSLLMGSAGHLKLRPTRITGNHSMKKHLLLLCLILATGIACPAQKKNKEVRYLFEEAGERNKEPAFQVFVMPQIADVEYLSTERETFGPYRFSLKSINDLNEILFQNLKSRAVHYAMREADADVIIAMVPHSYITEDDDKTIVVEITGYPAKYVNMRPIGKNANDFEMIRTVYPNAFSVSETKIIHTGEQGSSNNGTNATK